MRSSLPDSGGVLIPLLVLAGDCAADVAVLCDDLAGRPASEIRAEVRARLDGRLGLFLRAAPARSQWHADQLAEALRWRGCLNADAPRAGHGGFPPFN